MWASDSVPSLSSAESLPRPWPLPMLTPARVTWPSCKLWVHYVVPQDLRASLSSSLSLVIPKWPKEPNKMSCGWCRYESRIFHLHGLLEMTLDEIAWTHIWLCPQLLSTFNWRLWILRLKMHPGTGECCGQDRLWVTPFPLPREIRLCSGPYLNCDHFYRRLI